MSAPRRPARALRCSRAARARTWIRSRNITSTSRAALFRDGKVLQAPVAGTVARGDLARADEARSKPRVDGRSCWRAGASNTTSSARHATTASAPATASSCSAACRGRRACTTSGCATPTTSISSTSSPTATARCIPMRDRVRPRDRWAIVAYIRALQLSQHAALDDVPPEEQTRLAAEKHAMTPARNAALPRCALRRLRSAARSACWLDPQDDAGELSRRLVRGQRHPDRRARRAVHVLSGARRLDARSACAAVARGADHAGRRACCSCRCWSAWPDSIPGRRMPAHCRPSRPPI